MTAYLSALQEDVILVTHEHASLGSFGGRWKGITQKLRVAPPSFVSCRFRGLTFRYCTVDSEWMNLYIVSKSKHSPSRHSCTYTRQSVVRMRRKTSLSTLQATRS